ncbi:helix-turn-helix domain-containing protein [Sandaracinus amylolyticus]|uniref:helix-turn-helix domain-containing protein n=1 Tax=Sandaracinus amylolyticus TaxID=927083 RepID=UPI001F15A342|nr:helix-turn-helix domain-containing protein [Sandaracinus amylolyticus]
MIEERSANEPRVDVDWIDGDEAARMLGVSRDYLRRVQGLPRYGSSRARRYRRSEVDAYLRDRAGAPFSRG